jgi:hypothetical protein
MDSQTKNNNKKLLLAFIVLLWICTTYLAFNAFKMEATLSSNVIENSIQQKTTFSFKIDAKPSTLFPSGGLIDPESFIFTKLIKSFKVHINSSIISDKAINVSGTKKVSLQLVADQFWKRDYTLAPEAKFDLNGLSNEIFNNDYNVDIASLLDFIQKVEIETGTRSDKYLFKIKPEVIGKIQYEDNELPIDVMPEISLQPITNQIQIIGDKESSKSNKIERTNLITQKFKIFGLSFSLNLARYLFSFLSLVFLILSIYIFKKLTLKTKDISENDSIYKKHIDRIIPLKEDLEKDNINLVKIDSLKSLIKISNEKELPIFSFSINEKLLNFYIIDNKYIYDYEIK